MYSDEHYIQAIKTFLASKGLPDTYKDAYFLRRINVRIRKTKVSDLPTYFSFLKNHPDEFEDLKRDLSINVTKFFRDVESFRYFETVLVDRLRSHAKESKKPFRIWSAGCAIGCEPYSIAIILDKAIHKYGLHNVDVKVIATDFNPELLAFARTGIYDEAAVDDVSPEILNEYFDQTIDKTQYKIKYTAKKYVDFSHLDLTGNFPYKNLDVIVCRNVLIYFSSEAQYIIFKKYFDALKTNGILFIGKTETMHLSYRGNFNNISPRHRVYLKNDPSGLNEDQLRKTHVCSECGISFTRDLDLKIHFKKHEKERKKKQLALAEARGDKSILRCPHCDKTFITQSRYNAHLNVFHKIIRKRDPKDYF